MPSENRSKVTSTSKGMDKINESMNKIGSMLGVKPSTSSGSDDSKKEPFIRSQSGDSEPSDSSAVKRLKSMNSAEGAVIGPPTVKTNSYGQDEATAGTDERDGSYTTKPTTPAKTKTAAGAAIATFAATIDNTAHAMTKSFRKMKTSAENVTSNACGNDPEAGTTKGYVTADGYTTGYVSAEKEQREPCEVPVWLKVVGMTLLGTAVIVGIIAAIDGTAINQALRDLHDEKASQKDENVSVAFIGNSYLYVNDIPRVMESISDHRIDQNSVINTGAGLGSLLKQGNGMYELWKTPNALDYWDSWDFQQLMMSYGLEQDYEFYDWGACTVPQLLDGYDHYLSYKNKNGVYFDVGTNPCFEEPSYMTIVQSRGLEDPQYFDYVVLNDQTRRMADMDAREDSIAALDQAYVQLIKTSRAIPILVDTHAFYYERGDYNITFNQTNPACEDREAGEEEGEGMECDENEQIEYADEQYYEVFIGENMGAFTSAIYAGLYEYIEVLKYNLPARQMPKIAKIGMTYLAIYEDNRKIWNKLFADDKVHASPAGSYLFSVVLYATIYGHMPKPVYEETDVEDLFRQSRAIFGNQTLYPSVSEANYLRTWARRVQLEGYIPKTMIMPTPLEENNNNEDLNATNATFEYGEYDGDEQAAGEDEEGRQ